jgi:hypothetical protein
MALNTATITPAVIAAKDVATLADLPSNTTSATQTIPNDSTVDGLDASSIGSIVGGSTFTYTGGSSNVMFTYTASGWEQGGNPDALTNANFNTNITTIDGGKITTGSIDAAYINTSGLIADNIQAHSTIVGNAITGSNITGAIIEASVIKTSYLDLDGELEVLTNYHITVSMYNGDPSLYSDAVYISATTEYRIPSVSTVSDGNQSVSGSSPSLSSLLYSYNTANVGSNLKAVKLRPTIIVTSTTAVSSSTVRGSTDGRYFRSSDAKLYLNGVLVCSVWAPQNSWYFYENSLGSSQVTVANYSVNVSSVPGGDAGPGENRTYYFPVRTIYGIQIQAYMNYLAEEQYEGPNSGSFTSLGIRILSGVYTVTEDFDTIGPIYNMTASTGLHAVGLGSASVSTTSGIYINNLI